MTDALRDPGEFERGMRRVLWELREYVEDVIVIGGWVPYLYCKYGGFSDWQSSLSRTAEVDVLLGASLEPLGRQPLTTILQQAGLRPATQDAWAAVWIGELREGEKVEFLVPHTGTARQVGLPRPIETQPGLAALSLTDLEPLLDFTNTLRLPITIQGRPATELEIRVPWLGAYLTNKAATFSKRPGAPAAENPKRAKDLLYLRDIAAAGEEVVQQIASDCAAMRRANKRTRLRMDYAANNLRLLHRGTFSAVLMEAAEMLVERDDMEQAEALADLRGHLDDAGELLESA